MAALSFFTGFPGFIGRRLVERLLKAEPDSRVAALVEPSMVERARSAAADLEGGDRVEVLAGDITDRSLGLAADDLERLRGEVTTAFHLAAIYNLAVSSDVAQRVNVEGTGNVLDFCASCKNLERLNYVSTAYVAGTRHGVVYEHELELGQDFKNHYESTKFEAEVWVRSMMNQVPTTIYRPAIVVGDSRTGETQKFDGPYYMLRTISAAVQRHTPIPQFGASAAPFNVVPVDFVVEAMATASADPAAVGETLHLVDPDPISASDVLALLSKAYAGRGPSYRIAPRLVETSLRFKAVRAAFGGAPHEAIAYLNHPVRFDTRRADTVLGRAGLRAPRFEEYVEPVVSFFRTHEDDDAYVPADLS